MTRPRSNTAPTSSGAFTLAIVALLALMACGTEGTSSDPGDETGEDTAGETRDETGDPVTGDETGDVTGDPGTGDETGDDTSETDDGTGDETGDETDDGTGDETGDETDDETGDETGDETVCDGLGCACEADDVCAAFDDDDLCNGSPACIDGACAIDPDTVVVCEADSQCEVGACDPATGTCAASPEADGVACDDEEPCTSDDACAAGTCAGAPIVCDDGDACTDDVCDDVAGGCTYTPMICDDGSLCTDDACDSAGEGCTSEPVVCDDQIDCTVDVCDPLVGCTFKLIPGCPIDCGDGTCDDGVEHCENCAEDCGACPFCGDTTCDPDETCETCADDCGDCPPASDCCIALAQAGCEDPGCQEAVCGLDSFCCDVVYDQGCADTAAVACEICDGGPAPLSDCCVSHHSAGCETAACAETICELDTFCCDNQWDLVCAGDAMEACAVCIPPDDCCEIGGGPGCLDADCMATVCGADPSCCDTVWDVGCAGVALDACVVCELAPPGEGSCCASNGTPGCDDAECQDDICDVDPFCCDELWDGPCAVSALDVCPACEGQLGDCCAPNGTPGCEVPACAAVVCEADPTCCEHAWDEDCKWAAIEACPACADAPLGGACCEANDTPGCEDADCQGDVCGADFFCCDQVWDEICAEKAGETCLACMDDVPEDGDCCVPGDQKGCTDYDCENLVCTDDPSCCDTEWDFECAVQATWLCDACDDGGTTNCCIEHEGDGCNDPDCQVLVCKTDFFCCDTQWDSLCAEAANADCAICNEPEPDPAGDCCVANSTPSCGDVGCAEDVCSDDPFCCEEVWDDGCAILASAFCEDCQEEIEPYLDCCQPSDVKPGCVDEDCEETICEGDAFCCEDAWDETCVAAALALCNVCDLSTDCCEANNSPACSNEECTQIVCSQDSFCCNTSWDSLCASAATNLCDVCKPICGDFICLPQESCSTCEADCGPCPFCGDGFCNSDEACHNCSEDCGICSGPCCESSESSGCEDDGITSCVCGKDFSCCSIAWDDACVNQAYTCGCSGTCGDGACEPDEACSTCPDDCGTCPYCGDGECNNGEGCTTCPGDCVACDGDCCSSNGSVGCNDPTCQQIVCSQDTFCCNTSWDGLCAGAALDLCNVCGGGTICVDRERGLGEDCAGCPSDCGECPYCGDGLCNTADENCLTCAEDCGACAGDCCLTNNTAGCDDDVLSACVCIFDVFCCTTAWDIDCVAAAYSGCGCESMCDNGVCEPDEDCTSCAEDCGEANGTPACGDADCTAAVCAIDPFCCDNSWDSICAGEAQDLCAVCQICGDGSCGDGEDCAACPIDCGACPECGDNICNGVEDCQTCPNDCTPCSGDCCLEAGSTTPGCDDADITACVCALDSFCCTASWDAACVVAGYGCGCTSECGDANCDPSETCEVCPDDCGVCPFCGDGECLGAESCTNCPDDCTNCSGDCCVANGSVGCDNADCQTFVCANDAFCCDNTWDSICASAAIDSCEVCGAGGGGGGAGDGDCCQSNGTPGCSDPSCQSSICGADPFCCSMSWDGLCADAANASCAVCF